MAYLRSFGSKPRRTNIPPIPAGPEFRYLPVSSYRDEMCRPTCMYTIRQSPPPIHPACILHCPIHGPDPDQSKLRSRGTSWQVGQYRIVERTNTEREASIRLRSDHQLTSSLLSSRTWMISSVLSVSSPSLGDKAMMALSIWS
jgi:hypothetical protein